MIYLPYFLILKPEYIASTLSTYQQAYDTIMNVLEPPVIDDSDVLNTGAIFLLVPMDNIRYIHDDLQFLFKNYFLLFKSEADIMELFEEKSKQYELL